MITFIAWKSLSARTIRLSKILGAEIYFVKDSFPYIKAFIRTVVHLIKQRPRVVILQLPQGPLLLLCFLLKKPLKFKLIADAHTGFLHYFHWKEYLLNAPFKKLLNWCDAIIIHSSALKPLLEGRLLDRTLVIEDPLPEVEKTCPPPLSLVPKKVKAYFVFPASYAPDEPLDELISAAQIVFKKHPNFLILLTGNWKRRPDIANTVKKLPFVLLTGFLSTPHYYHLLKNARAVLALTKRSRSGLLASAADGVACETPLIASDLKELRNIITKGAVFVKNAVESIADAIEMLLDENTYKLLKAEMKTFKEEYISRLERKLSLLRRIIAKFLTSTSVPTVPEQEIRV